MKEASTVLGKPASIRGRILLERYGIDWYRGLENLIIVPLEQGCEFSAFLLMHGISLEPFVSSTGRIINFITVMPIYAEELEFSKRTSLLDLVTTLVQNDIPSELAPRKNIGV